MCSGVEKRSWQIKVDLPDTGLPLFHESLPQTLRRRIEGKQAQLPREKRKETDEARWAKMPPRLRTRDQKRVLHNRTVERGLHLFPPFKSMDEWIVRCLRRERDIDLWTWSGQKKIFNLTARLELKCGGDDFQGEEHSAVRRNGAVNPAIRQLQSSNNKKREANGNNWGVQPRKHIFFLCNPSNAGEVRCRRPQCWLYRESRNMTTWPTLQLAECRQTRTKNQHQARAPGEIPTLEAEMRGTLPDEVCSDTT